jgi:hypothetical protein
MCGALPARARGITLDATGEAFMKTAELMLLIALTVLSVLPARATDCLKLKSVTASYDALRQGSSMEVQVAFQTTNDCLLEPITAQQAKQPRYSMDTAPSSGLKMQAIGFGFRDAAPHLAGFHGFHLILRVEAVSDAAPGQRQIPARLHFPAQDRDGNSDVRTLAFEIPINVVPATATVAKRPVQEKRPAFNPLDIPLIPVRILRCLGEILQNGNCGS